MYEGPHCEMLRTNEAIITSESSSDVKDGTPFGFTIFLGMFCMLILVAMLFGARQLRRIRKRKNEPVAEVNLQGFRDDDEEEGFTAFSPNGNMLFPAFSSGPSVVSREEIMVLKDIDLS